MGKLKSDWIERRDWGCGYVDTNANTRAFVWMMRLIAPRTDWFKLQPSKSVELGVTSHFEVAVGTFSTICEFDSGGSATLWNSQLFSKVFFLGVKIEFV